MDNSIEVAKKIQSEDSRVTIIKLSRNYGKSNALNIGFQMSKGDIVVTMDADLQDDPSEIKNLLTKIEEGWDVVSGWKKNRKDPLSKRIPSKLFNFIVRKVSNLNINDFNCGLKAYKRKVTKTLNIYGGLHRFIPYLAVSNGFSVTEIAVNHRARQFGESKYGGSRMFKGFFDFLSVVFITKYSKRPLHIFGFIGFLLSLIGIIINMYLTMNWFYGYPLANRPLLFLGMLLIILGIQIFSIGFIAELLVNYLSNRSKTIDKIIKRD